MDMREFDSPAENTWCPGCNNFSIESCAKFALAELVNSGVAKPEELVMVAGIGCHGKIDDYVKANSFYALHGRVAPPATGIKIANQRLKVLAFAGDGDAYDEGISHVIHAARKNVDIAFIVHNNEVFALTTSQATPTTKIGFKAKSVPKGSFEPPLNPLHLMLACGATFVARGYSGNPRHLRSLIMEAVKHKGFGFIDVIQECVTYNPIREKYGPKIYELKEDHDPTNFSAAWEKAKEWDEKIPIGILYRVEKEIYEKQLLGDRVLVEEKPLPSIQKVLQEFM